MYWHVSAQCYEIFSAGNAEKLDLEGSTNGLIVPFLSIFVAMFFYKLWPDLEFLRVKIWREFQLRDFQLKNVSWQ